MNVQFSDCFNKECRDNFHIAQSTIRDAISNPTDSQIINFKGLSLLLLTKQVGEKYTLLISARKKNDDIIVDLAFKIKPDLSKGTLMRKPMDLLQQLIEKFGLEISIGGYSRKLFIEQTIDIKENVPTEIVKVNNPLNHKFIQSMFIKINKDNNKQVECAIAYAVDTSKYLNWLNN